MRGGWLDALRFIVASLIILHHFEISAPGGPLADTVHPALKYSGFLLTNFFLIDSGYVLMRVYGRHVSKGAMSAKDFFLKRFLRIAPAHLMMGLGLAAVVFAAGFVGVAPTSPEWFDWRQLPAQLTLTQAYGVPGGYGWNAPSWSISALLGCYLLFPLILRGLTRLGPWTVLIGAAGAYLLVNQASWTFTGYPIWQMPMGYGFMRALPLFALGMSLAWFAEKVWVAPRAAAVLGLSGAAAFFALQWFDKHALLSLVCISAIILAAGWIPTPKPSRWVQLGAQMAFAMFISNEVVRILWMGAADVLTQKFALPVAAQWGLWGAGVVFAFAFAATFHVVVDQPLQDRIRGWLKRRSAKPEPKLAPVVSLEG